MYLTFLSLFGHIFVFEFMFGLVQPRASLVTASTPLLCFVKYHHPYQYQVYHHHNLYALFVVANTMKRNYSSLVLDASTHPPTLYYNQMVQVYCGVR